jgi:hypothetical protein
MNYTQIPSLGWSLITAKQTYSPPADELGPRHPLPPQPANPEAA